jgi:hypothetical protein
MTAQVISLDKYRAIQHARYLKLLPSIEAIGLSKGFAQVGGFIGLFDTTSESTTRKQAVYIWIRINIELEDLAGAIAEALKTKDPLSFVRWADKRYLPWLED